MMDIFEILSAMPGADTWYGKLIIWTVAFLLICASAFLFVVMVKV